MMGTIGKCSIVPKNIKKGIMDSHLIRIKMSKEMLPEFFECVYDKVNGGICYIQMQYEKKGSITDGLNNSIVKELKVPVPSVEEQKKIIEYLNNKCSKIDLILTDREH